MKGVKALSIIFAEFESILKSATDSKDGCHNTKIYQDQIVCSYGYTLKCVDEQYFRPKSYFGEGAIGKFMGDIRNERILAQIVAKKF